MEKVKASQYCEKLRKKVSGNGIEDQAEGLIVRDRLEKYYKVDIRSTLVSSNCTTSINKFKQ